MRTVMIDLMFTVLQPLKNRWELYREMLAFLGIKATAEEIARSYKEARRLVETEETGHTGGLPKGYYEKHWSRINAKIIELLDPATQAAEQKGQEIYRQVMSNPVYYTVPYSTREFFTEGETRGYAFCLVTNQELSHVSRLLSAFDLTFAEMIVSDEVGFKKPDSRFFAEAIARVNVPISDIAFIGNNPRNDMEGAARAGIRHRFLFDPRGEHVDTTTSAEYVSLTALQDVFDLF